MRPPMRLRPSRMVTWSPALVSARAAVNPAAPAPTIKQSNPPLWSAVPPPTLLRLDQARPDRIPHHAGSLVHVQLLENPAAVRVGRFVAGSRLERGFLRGFAAGDQHQHLSF